jgi:hypothetical protein
MQIPLALKRKIKTSFLRYNLHKIFSPLVAPLLNVAYLSKFSQWRAANSQPAFNDFYLKQWDYTKRYAMYEFLQTVLKPTEPINYLEFGVFEGSSFRWWASHNTHSDSRFYGFDTFEGLPEAWDQFSAGDMTTKGNIPKMDDVRVKFIKGLFQDTLPDFLKQFDNSKRKVVHLDADLYSSTLYTLAKLDDLLKPGDVVMFDEFGVPTHEFKAFVEYTTSFRREFEIIAATNNYFFTAFLVKK